jgi:hypothetical protein
MLLVKRQYRWIAAPTRTVQVRCCYSRGVARFQSRGHGSVTWKRTSWHHVNDLLKIQDAFGATPPGSATSAEISSDPKGIWAIKINLEIILKCHVLYHCWLSHLYKMLSLPNNFQRGLIVYSFKRLSSDWHLSSVSCYWWNENLRNSVHSFTLQQMVNPTCSLYFQL